MVLITSACVDGSDEPACTHDLANLLVYIQSFALVGGMSRRLVSLFKSECLYIHEFFIIKILVA